MRTQTSPKDTMAQDTQTGHSFMTSAAAQTSPLNDQPFNPKQSSAILTQTSPVRGRGVRTQTSPNRTTARDTQTSHSFTSTVTQTMPDLPNPFTTKPSNRTAQSQTSPIARQTNGHAFTSTQTSPITLFQDMATSPITTRYFLNGTDTPTGSPHPLTGPFTASTPIPLSGNTDRENNAQNFTGYLDMLYEELSSMSYEDQYDAIGRLPLEQREALANLALDNLAHPISRLPIFQRNIALLSPGSSEGSSVIADPGEGYRSPPNISPGSSGAASAVSVSPNGSFNSVESVEPIRYVIDTNGVGPARRVIQRDTPEYENRRGGRRTGSPLERSQPSRRPRILEDVYPTPPRPNNEGPAIKPPAKFRRANAPPGIATTAPSSRSLSARRVNVNRTADSFIPDRTRTTRTNN